MMAGDFSYEAVGALASLLVNVQSLVEEVRKTSGQEPWLLLAAQAALQAQKEGLFDDHYDPAP